MGVNLGLAGTGADLAGGGLGPAHLGSLSGRL